ncbi:MAG: acyl-CoA dehydrogenase [Rhodopseudomonas sp.]|nr:acyl-CoA dehydrogenase [Rhodopseudomonas sp.]
MLRSESEAELAFRREVRGWFERELPAELRDLTFRPLPDMVMPWYRKLSRQGWIAPHWPRAFGGMDASPVEQVILMEEAARIGAPEIPTQGLNQIGPILQRFGSDAQKEFHLPRILNGDAIWCQGYSEPGAGSDLASLRTAGSVEGDDVVVTGHKIWTTWGHHADWMYALVRTNKDVPKREGISFILIDMKSSGVLRRPIRTLADEFEFCEVFLDKVRVPRANIVGELNRGWTVATALLSQERLILGSPGNALRAYERLRRLARALGTRLSDSDKLMIAKARIELETLIASFLDAAEGFRDGRPVDSSYLKILSTETTQFILDAAQTVSGAYAGVKFPMDVDGTTIDFSELFLQSRRLSIYGGSNEIQRDLIARNVLAMPRGRA